MKGTWYVVYNIICPRSRNRWAPSFSCTVSILCDYKYRSRSCACPGAGSGLDPHHRKYHRKYHLCHCPVQHPHHYSSSSHLQTSFHHFPLLYTSTHSSSVTPRQVQTESTPKRCSPTLNPPPRIFWLLLSIAKNAYYIGIKAREASNLLKVHQKCKFLLRYISYSHQLQIPATCFAPTIGLCEGGNLWGSFPEGIRYQYQF